MRRTILTEEDRNKIFNLEFSDEELIEYFTITTTYQDRVSRINKDYNKVGYLIQKYILKSRGYILNTFESGIPKNLIEYISKQIGVESVDLSLYSRTTRHEDARSIMKELGYKKFKLTNDIKHKAFEIALSNSSKYKMMIDFIYYLRREKMILPSVSTLEKTLWEGIRESEEYIYSKVLSQIVYKSKLESFLDVRDRVSDYSRVKEIHKGIEDILNKISILEKYDLDIDLDFISHRKLQSMYEAASILSREQLQRLCNKEKQIAYILIFVKQEIKRLEDELIITERLEEKNRLNKKMVTKDNIVKAYNHFLQELGVRGGAYSEVVLVNTFLDTLICKNKKGYLKIKKGLKESKAEKIYIDDKLNDFKDKYILEKYTETEKRELIANSDKLKDITTRRLEGEYYTGREWVDEAHKMLEQELGADWKSRYIVYDCSAGKGNLTNSYNLKDLYNSTLNEEDLKNIQNGVSFQLDFLNDGIESPKIPSELINSLNGNKPIVMILNPPYLANKVKFSVHDGDLGVASNLYTQFLIQILNIKKRYNLTNMYIAVFSPMSYLTRDRYDKFRSEFLKEFDFKSGFIFPANEFNSVYGRWSTSFCIWGSGECKKKNEFLVLQKEKDENGNITTNDMRVLRNED